MTKNKSDKELPTIDYITKNKSDILVDKELPEVDYTPNPDADLTIEDLTDAEFEAITHTKKDAQSGDK